MENKNKKKIVSKKSHFKTCVPIVKRIKNPWVLFEILNFLLSFIKNIIEIRKARRRNRLLGKEVVVIGRQVLILIN